MPDSVRLNNQSQREQSIPTAPCSASVRTCRRSPYPARVVQRWVSARILNCCVSLKVILCYEIKEEISGYHFVYSLSHYELPAVFVLHLNSLKKFCTSPGSAPYYRTNLSLSLGEFLWTKYVRSILCAVLHADRMKSRLSWGIFWPVLLLDWNL
jgi:hypothetical protein